MKAKEEELDNLILNTGMINAIFVIYLMLNLITLVVFKLI